MAGERTGRKTLGTTPSHRRRLSNITNLVNGSSWSNENELVKSIYNTSELQLQQEIKKLEQITAEKDKIIAEKDLIVAEKDQEIESQKLFIHKMQRDFYANICKRSQQNEEIIGFNIRLSKELSNVREQLKLLQHEYTQMALVFKINESELQTRLAETQEQMKRVLEEKDKASHNLVNTDENPTTATRRTRNSFARRHSMIGVGLEPDAWNPSTNTTSTSCLDTTAVTTRGGTRQRASAVSQKDNSLKLKIRQHDCASMPIIVAACSTKRYNNRYGHLNNLEPMQELVEEPEPQTTSISITASRRSRGNPSLESLSSDVTESEIATQPSSNGQRGGDVASTSESNAAGVITKSSDQRLAIKVHKNPPPARPNTPQRRAASQPSTPRKRSEAHTVLQKKAGSQPGTPGSTSPVRHADSLPASRSLLSRTQASSPLRPKEPEQPQPPSRMSLGARPSRRAAESVISYKEPSLISKMRRPQ